jgi:PAS domain S-box-containing protein
MSRPHVSFETQGVRYESHLSDNDARAAVEGIDYFTSDGSVDEEELSHAGRRRRRASLSIAMPPPQSQAGLAFTALQYLPMPVLVLSTTKHIVLANEAVGRLLGIDLDEAEEDEEDHCGDGTHNEEPDVQSTADLLRGKTLGELGIDLLQGGNAVFVSWEDILQNVVDDASKAQKAYKKHCEGVAQDKEDGISRDTRNRSHSVASSKYSHSGMKKTTEVHDAAVDIVFSTVRDSKTGIPKPAPDSVKEQVARANAHMQAKMIISVWATEEDQYFTLTFTAASDVDTGKASSSSGGTMSHSGSTTELSKRVVSRPNPSLHSGFPSAVSSNSSSSPSDTHRKTRRGRGSPASTPNVPSPISFPPRGPPDKTAQAAAPTIFTKSNRLKDAILNSMSFPAYAMWRDSTFGVPNKAAIQLLYPYADSVPDTNESATEFLSRYVLYREDFDELIPLDDIPIMRLMREQERFEGYRVGMYSAKDGSRVLYDVQGEPMLDDKGVFIGGLVVFNDVTDFQNTINEQKVRNERQFEDITNMIPQMIWRTTATGEHDYYSKRWYDYTGLTVEQSEGEGWMNGFHADDLEVARPKWAHSLATGDEYLTEYRARSAIGEWRWMLGRAVPMRDERGEILKWFGTCTDIHDLVLAREEAKQTRAQLEQVIEHARITLWAVDLNCSLTLFEGRAMYEPDNKDLSKAKQSLLGTNLWDIFKLQDRNNEIHTYKPPLKAILAGTTADVTIEQEITSTGRWFRTRLVPILRRERAGGIEGDAFIDGVVGVSMDVTEMKQAEQDLQRRNQDNANLMAQSVAAKEASKMKSQFLANMSHEIRTPIAGVIGMSELLLDDDIGELTKDQRECAENIQRSANGLLTVINDILDFSKVESGRLDIEEVQFDLSVVIKDVNSMLSFAAERKGLNYVDDIPEIQNWKVMGEWDVSTSCKGKLLTRMLFPLQVILVACVKS